jgi:hypothetical protein
LGNDRFTPAANYLQHPFLFRGKTRAAVKNHILSMEEDEVDWCLLPIGRPKQVRLWMDKGEAKLMVLPGLAKGLEYHPIRVLRQLRHTQVPFQDAIMPRRFAQYPQDSIHIMHQINDALKNGVSASQLGIQAIAVTTPEFLRMRAAYWPTPYQSPKCRGAIICQVPPIREIISQEADPDKDPRSRAQKKARCS